MRQFSSPHSVYERRDAGRDASFFQQLVDAEQLTKFIVGLPVHMSGDESEKSMEARAFGRWLAQATGKEVEFFDERFTSKQADEYMALGKIGRNKKKSRRDMIAAQVLLANYLERGSNSQPQSLDD